MPFLPPRTRSSSPRPPRASLPFLPLRLRLSSSSRLWRRSSFLRLPLEGLSALSPAGLLAAGLLPAVFASLFSWAFCANFSSLGLAVRTPLPSLPSFLAAAARRASSAACALAASRRAWRSARSCFSRARASWASRILAARSASSARRAASSAFTTSTGVGSGSSALAFALVLPPRLRFPPSTDSSLSCAGCFSASAAGFATGSVVSAFTSAGAAFSALAVLPPAFTRSVSACAAASFAARSASAADTSGAASTAGAGCFSGAGCFCSAV